MNDVAVHTLLSKDFCSVCVDLAINAIFLPVSDLFLVPYSHCSLVHDSVLQLCQHHPCDKCACTYAKFNIKHMQNGQ